MNINRVIVSMLLVATTLSCGRKQRQKEMDTQMKLLVESNEILKSEINNRDSIMNDALFTISDISASLSAIRAREGAVISRAETGRVAKDKIKEDLEYISAALESKKTAMASLQSSMTRLKEANIEMGGLTMMVEQLQREMSQSDSTITALLNNIDNLNRQISIIKNDRNKLAENNNQLEIQLSEAQREMNRAYYIVGSESELVEKEILLKKGVIGRTLVTNPNVDKSRLIEIDIQKLDKIEIKASKVEVIGEFAQNSYTLVAGEQKKDVESLIIDNKEAFWRDSKILIITYKK